MQDLIKVQKYIFSLGGRCVSSRLWFICLLSRCRVVNECCFMSVNRQAVAQCGGGPAVCAQGAFVLFAYILASVCCVSVCVCVVWEWPDSILGIVQNCPPPAAPIGFSNWVFQLVLHEMSEIRSVVNTSLRDGHTASEPRERSWLIEDLFFPTLSCFDPDEASSDFPGVKPQQLWYSPPNFISPAKLMVRNQDVTPLITQKKLQWLRGRVGLANQYPIQHYRVSIHW